MRKYFFDKKEDIRSYFIVSRLIKPVVSKSFVSVVIGPRRAGKSFFMYDLIRRLGLRDEDFLFLNFEDDEVKALSRSDVVRCVQKHVEVYGKEPEYVFFDEIQNLEGWRSFIYSLVEKKRYFIFVSGSSSKLLSKEIATELRGRGLNVVVFPFSFKEFLSVRGFKFKRFYSSLEEAKIKGLLKDYLQDGGFPQVVLGEIEGRVFLREYLNVVLYKDLIERYKIENPEAARMLIYSVIQSAGSKFSINKVYNQLKQKVKVGNKTLYQYFSYLDEVFFAFSLRKFSYSRKKSLLSIPKVYVNDTGLIFSFGFSNNFGRLMENLVFIELKKSELNNEFDVFYWQDVHGHEVDFVVKKGLGVEQLIQVTNASNRDEVEGRELKALVKASKELACDDLLVLTWDYEATEEVKGKRVKFVPLWKWLLEKD